MYEYVQTAKGWVLCWGGASLYQAKKPAAPAAAAPKATQQPKILESRRPAARAA